MKAIVVGSGISGLTAACYLVDRNYEVAVFEQYPAIGGVTGSISRDGFTWNQGQLLIEGFSKGEQAGNVLADIALTDKIDLIRSDRVYSFPGYKIEKKETYDGPLWRMQHFKDLFPADTGGLNRYYRDYVRFMELMTLARRSERSSGLPAALLKLKLYLKLLPFLPVLKWDARKLSDRYFKSHKLQAAFLSILADFVVRPSEFQGLGIFAVNPEPAFDLRTPLQLSKTGFQPGYTYVKGGVGSIIEQMADKVTSKQGKIITDAVVQKILVENEKAIGVQLSSGDLFFADQVFVSGGAREFVDLLDGADIPDSLQNHVEELPLMESVFMVHLGVKYDPGVHQKAATTYYYNTYDIEGSIDEVKSGIYHEGKHGFVIYIPSKHTPEMAPDGHHAVTIYTIAPNNLDEGSWEDRKEEMSDKLIAEAEKYIPGLNKNTVVKLIVTPDDFKNRTHLKHHAFGGVAPVMGKKGLPHQTPFKNLWFIGAQSESGAGMNNVMEGVWRAIKKMDQSVDG